MAREERWRMGRRYRRGKTAAQRVGALRPSAGIGCRPTIAPQPRKLRTDLPMPFDHTVGETEVIALLGRTTGPAPTHDPAPGGTVQLQPPSNRSRVQASRSFAATSLGNPSRFGPGRRRVHAFALSLEHHLVGTRARRAGARAQDAPTRRSRCRGPGARRFPASTCTTRAVPTGRASCGCSSISCRRGGRGDAAPARRAFASDRCRSQSTTGIGAKGRRAAHCRRARVAATPAMLRPRHHHPHHPRDAP